MARLSSRNLGKECHEIGASRSFDDTSIRARYTTPYRSQLPEIAVPLPEKPAPVPVVLGDEHEVEAILAHRRRDRGYQFMTLLKGTATRDAEWQPTRDLIDPDGTMTQALRTRIQFPCIDADVTKEEMGIV
jgi:hypothetical protein